MVDAVANGFDGDSDPLCGGENGVEFGEYVLSGTT